MDWFMSAMFSTMPKVPLHVKGKYERLGGMETPMTSPDDFSLWLEYQADEEEAKDREFFQKLVDDYDRWFLASCGIKPLE